MATGSERAWRQVSGRGWQAALLLVLLSAALADARPALAQAGGTAACVCYCGIHLRPPCGDDACKRACGWRPPSTGDSNPGGAAAGAIGGAISSGIRNAIEQSRARAAEEALRQQRLLEESEQIMQSFDQMSRERVRAEDQMLQEAMQRARHLEEQSREDALSTMKRMPETQGDLVLNPGTSFFGTPGNPTGDVPADASVVDLRALDVNRPITVDQSVLRLGQHAEPQRGQRHIDCPQTRAARDRLAGGLPVQVAAIQKTEAQLQAARQGVQLARTESKAVLLRAAVDEAKGYAQDVLTSAKGLRAQIGALKGLDPAKRDTLIRATNALVFGGEDLQDVFTAAEAGYRAGEEVQRKTDHLSRQVADIADKLLMESGIAEKVGEELAGKLWGPLGELGFRGAKLSIEFGVATGKGLISQSEHEAAQKHLETMQNQYERAKRRIAELDRDLMDLCTDTAQAKQ